MTTHTRGRATIVATLTAGAVALLFCAGAQAGPDCSKNPDHPSCAGDPGGDGGNGCALTMENPPAFAFGTIRKSKGRSVAALSLANADGSCTESLGVNDVEEISFHFDEATQAGAVTYLPGPARESLYIVRFAVDGNGLSVDPPQLLLAQLDDPNSCCFGADVAGTPGAELVAVDYFRDLDGEDRRGLELIDTAACLDGSGVAIEPCPAASISTVFEISTADRNSCMAGFAGQPGYSVGDEYFVGDCYRPTYGSDPKFAANGQTIYINAATTGQLGDYYGIVRFTRKTGTDCNGIRDTGTGWCGPELIVTNDDQNTYPSVRGIHPVDGTLLVDYDDGIVGGLRNILIAFLDPDACVINTAARNHWMSCLSDGLPSGVRRGRRANWLPIGGGYDILYNGFDSGERDTVRAFTPTTTVSNDRELLTKANWATSGL